MCPKCPPGLNVTSRFASFSVLDSVFEPGFVIAVVFILVFVSFAPFLVTLVAVMC